LIRLAKAFALYGAPSHRLEYQLSSLSETIHLPSIFFFSPGLMLIHFGDELSSAASQSCFVRTPQGYNMAKLAQVNALCMTVKQDLLSVKEANALLDRVRMSKDYSPVIILTT
jgi:uncharacterized membrane protein YjjP (DUF1212 family)